jgi:hypothetical protein
MMMGSRCAAFLTGEGARRPFPNPEPEAHGDPETVELGRVSA